MRDCPICGKKFDVLRPNLWTYKRQTANGLKYFCTYSCMRKYDEDGENKKMKLTLEQKKKAVQIALEGGDPLKYLDDAGAKDKYSAWYYIKKKLMETDPETYKKLIEKQNTPTVKVTGGLRIETPEADKVEVVETPEKPKNMGPIYYNGMRVSAVSGDYGIYSLLEDDIGHLWLDYKDTQIKNSKYKLCLSADHWGWGWGGFIKELCKAALILGVDLNDQGDT